MFQLISNNGTAHRVMNKHSLPYTKMGIRSLAATPSKHGVADTDVCLRFRLSGTKRFVVLVFQRGFAAILGAVLARGEA